MHSKICYTSVKTLTLARFLLKVLYPHLKSKEFLIYLFIKYVVHISFIKMYSDYDKNGLKCEVIPEETIAEKHSTKKHNKSSHIIVVPTFLFDKLYEENIFYRDENSVWVMVQIHDENNIVPDVKKILTNLKMIEFNCRKNKRLTTKKNDSCYTERIVQIVSSQTVDKQTLYLSNTEFFNIKQNVYSDDLRLKFLSIPSKDFAPKLAKQLVVEMVLTSVNIGLDLSDQILINYFKTPKFLHQNDYFSVELTEEFTKSLHYKYIHILKSVRRIYFKCVEICGNDKVIESNTSTNVGYFVVIGETELKQNQNFNSFIPNRRHMCLKCCHSDTNDARNINYIDVCPFGLLKYFNELKECVEPFMIRNNVSLLNNHIKCTLQPVFLLSGDLGSGRTVISKSVAEYFGLHFVSETCRRIVSSTAKQTESKIEALLQKAKKSAPVLIHLQDFEKFGLENDNTEDTRIVEYLVKKLNELFLNFTKFPIIFVVSCESNCELKPNLKRLFLEEMKINSLDLDERLCNLVWLCLVNRVQYCDEKFIKISAKKQETTNEPFTKSRQDILTKLFIGNEFLSVLKKVASKTQGFVHGDLDLLIEQSLHSCFMAQDDNFAESDFLCKKDNIGLVREQDFEDSLETIRKLQSKKFGALRIPKVDWQDIGGLEELKKEIFRTIELPLKYPHLLANAGLKRSGLLLWGPPGCGKTLVARAIASQLKATFLSVKGPELLDMYVGQSEKNMRDIFSTARTSAPCVIFMDEAEAVAGARGASGDAGGAADRLVSQLLAELDGVASTQHKENAPVIVIAATNRPDLMEPALLRPGRLDKLLYVGPYVGTSNKVRVLTAVSRNFNLSGDVNLKEISNMLPDKCTGADLASVINNSRRKALVRTINKVENGEIGLSELSESDVTIENEDLIQSIQQFTPSVSPNEMNHYENLRTKLS